MKVSDIFTIEAIYEETSNTIFDVLSEVDDENPVYPLVSAFINEANKTTLNYDYFLSNSADKFVSPLVERYFTQDNDIATLSEMLADIVYNRFGEKWKRIYDALLTEYNPLENYSMEEIRTPDLTTDETQNEKTDITTERETSASNSYKGFNATDPVLVNQTDGDETTTTSGAKADNEVSKKIEQTGTETLTRAGNIGVTTSQQMLESEFKVRQYDFYKMMYNDIDSILCLSIY